MQFYKYVCSPNSLYKGNFKTFCNVNYHTDIKQPKINFSKN